MTDLTGKRVRLERGGHVYLGIARLLHTLPHESLYAVDTTDARTGEVASVYAPSTALTVLPGWGEVADWTKCRFGHHHLHACALCGNDERNPRTWEHLRGEALERFRVEEGWPALPRPAEV